MLQWLRRNSRHAFIYLLFVILIAMFVFSLGGGGQMARSRNPNNVSVVYDQVIDVKTFSNELSDREREYRNVLGDQWTDEMSRQLGLPQQVLASLENRVLLEHGARALGLEVTDTELKDRVIKLPGFVTNGAFDYERYKRALAYQRRTPRQFEELLRGDLLVEKMQQFLSGSAHVSRDEVLAAWRSAREKVTLDYIALDLGAYRGGARPRTTRSRPSPPAQAARSRATTRAFEYKRPAQVRARHILLTIPPGTPAGDEAKIRVRADALAAEARKPGADFGKLARENSADPGSRDKGGDLGWLSPGQTVKVFDQAAFGAKEKQIVGPVRSEFGWHILRIEEKRPAVDRKLDEVKDEIARQLVTDEKAKAAAEKAARTLLDAARGGKDFGSLPLPAKATRGTTAAFTREATEVPGLGASETLIQTAFALTPAAPVAPSTVTVGEKLAVVRLRSRICRKPSDADLLPIRAPPHRQAGTGDHPLDPGGADAGGEGEGDRAQPGNPERPHGRLKARGEGRKRSGTRKPGVEPGFRFSAARDVSRPSSRGRSASRGPRGTSCSRRGSRAACGRRRFP
jgi:peptidyl-prolyl cis-trans isomerase D